MVSEEDFLKIEKPFINAFYYKDRSGVKESNYVNTINFNILEDKYIEKYAYSLSEAMSYLEQFDGNAYLFEVLDYASDEDVQVSNLSRFFIEKTVGVLGQNKISISNHKRNRVVTSIDINSMSDVSFFEGVLQKEFQSHRCAINNPEFFNVNEGFNS